MTVCLLKRLLPFMVASHRCFGILELGLIVGGLIVTNVSFVAAAVLLYRSALSRLDPSATWQLAFISLLCRLTLKVLKDAKLALLSSLLFCIGPGGPFMSSMYVHTLCAPLP